MSSDRQIATNQRNAQQSTGPRTPEGKAKVAVNAVKHGLTARDVVLMNETADEFESFRRALVADMAPQGELEQALAERIAIGFWRLRRVPMFEAALYRRGFHELIVERESTTCDRLELSQCERTSALLLRKEVAQCDRAVFQQAANRLGQAQAALDEPSLTIIRILEKYGATLTNLWRHETDISRTVYKMLHELQRLQAARAGQPVPAPSVVDVNINLPDAPRPVDEANLIE